LGPRYSDKILRSVHFDGPKMNTEEDRKKIAAEDRTYKCAVRQEA